jgi:hypothetical protein
MSTPRKPRTLNLTTTSSEANYALNVMQLRAQGVAVPRTTVLSARVSVKARESVQALARGWGTTPSRMLGSLLTMLSESGDVAPTPDQLKSLRAVCAALGLPADSDAETIKIALIALLEAAVPPEPSNSDPLAASPDAPPAQLSHAELAAMTPADRGRHHIEAGAARRARRAAGDKPLASNLATRKR